MKKLIILVILLMALSACTEIRNHPLESSETEIPQVGMPNPASVFCEQHGNKLEIQTASDGSQNGICIFPDGSTCDEWAYFRGECGLAPQKSSTPTVIVEATKEATDADPGENASGGFMPEGTSEEIADWWGVIESTPSGAQYDDYFVRQDLGQSIYFGIDSMDPAVQAQIEGLRDSGKIVHLYGTLLSNVPDYNGSQILVDRIVLGHKESRV